MKGWDVLDKIWATVMAIMIGAGFINYIFNYEERPFSWVGPTIYFICFVLLLIQIKTNRSLIGWIRHWRRLKKELRDSARRYIWRCADAPEVDQWIWVRETKPDEIANLDAKGVKELTEGICRRLGINDHIHIFKQHPMDDNYTNDRITVFDCPGYGGVDSVYRKGEKHERA